MPDTARPDPARPVTAREPVDADLLALGNETAAEARDFLSVVRGVAAGESPDSAIPLLILALSQIVVTGTRLGAINDVVPTEQFEPDTGEDDATTTLRDNLARLLSGIDEYVAVLDPITSDEKAGGSISADVADVAAALLHGLGHHAEGRITEALWWWQFSYLSSWGDHALCAMRALLSIMSHIRLDADEETVAEAEFDALHGH